MARPRLSVAPLQSRSPCLVPSDRGCPFGGSQGPACPEFVEGSLSREKPLPQRSCSQTGSLKDKDGDIRGRSKWFVHNAGLGGLFRTIGDPAPAEVIRRELHRHPVSREDLYEMHAHLAAQVGKHPMAVRQFDAKHGVWERL